MRIPATVLAIALGLNLSWAVPVAFAQPEVPVPTRARSLAENILGTGLIRSLTITEGGSTLLMRWEAATYKAGQKVEETKDQLFGEAELVTGSIMGGLNRISRIRFTMSRKDGQVLATGVNTRGPGVTLMFSPLLGGGSVTSSAPKDPGKGKTTPGGSSAAKD